MTGILSVANWGVYRVDDRDLAFELRGERWETMGFTNSVYRRLEWLEDLPFTLWCDNVPQNPESQNAESNIADETHPNIYVMKCLPASSLSHNDVQEAEEKKHLLNDWFWEKCWKNTEMWWMKKWEYWNKSRKEKGTGNVMRKKELNDRIGNQKQNLAIIYSATCHSKPAWLSFFCRAQKGRFWRLPLSMQLQ